MTSFEGGPVEETSPGTDMELLARRELAVRATDAISEVLEVDVTVGALMRLAEAQEADDVRLAAKRALRCIESVGRPGSEVVQAVGETGIYHYVEGVITFGASEQTYLELVRTHRLSAEETTGMYALRELIANEADGSLPGFPTVNKALQSLGISPKQAGSDPEGALVALSDAGYFVDHIGRATFDRPIFFPFNGAQLPPLGRDIDSITSSDATAWLRQYVEETSPLEEES